jgi:hypothetical protein
LVSVEDGACYTNTNSSSATSAHAICQALNARTLFDSPSKPVVREAKAATMMVAPVAAATIGSHARLVWSSPPPLEQWRNSNKGGRQVKAEATKRAIATATRVASNDNGNGDGGKSNGNSDEGGGQVTMRGMVVATTVAGDNEDNHNGDNGNKESEGAKAMAMVTRVASKQWQRQQREQ